MKIKNLIFRDLYKSKKGLLTSTLYSRYSIEPEKMALFILKNKKKIEYKDNRIKLIK